MLETWSCLTTDQRKTLFKISIGAINIDIPSAIHLEKWGLVRRIETSDDTLGYDTTEEGQQLVERFIWDPMINHYI